MTLERSGKYVVATFPLGQEPTGQLGREDPDVVLADSDEAITRPSCGRIRLIHGCRARPARRFCPMTVHFPVRLAPFWSWVAY